MKLIEVVGAVIVRDNLILCTQRGKSGHLPMMWEFPGGKIEPDESPRQALEREIQEELKCLVEIGPEIASTFHEYEFARIRLTTFFCTLVAGEPELSEHAAMAWLSPVELPTLEWAPADVPAVELLIKGLTE